MLLHILFTLSLLGAMAMDPKEQNQQSMKRNKVLNPTFAPHKYKGPQYYKPDDINAWRVTPYHTGFYISTWREVYQSIEDDDNGLGMYFKGHRDYSTVVRIDQGGIYLFTARAVSVGGIQKPVILKLIICGNQFDFNVKKVITFPKKMSWSGILQAGNCVIQIIEQHVEHGQKFMVFLSDLTLQFKHKKGPTPELAVDSIINGDFSRPPLEMKRMWVFTSMKCPGWVADNPSTLIRPHFFNQNFETTQQGILLSQFAELTTLKQLINISHRMQLLLIFDWSQTHQAFYKGEAWISWNSVPIFNFFHRKDRLKIHRYYFQVFGRQSLYNTLEFSSKGFTKKESGYIVTNVGIRSYKSQMGHYKLIVRTEEDMEKAQLEVAKLEPAEL